MGASYRIDSGQAYTAMGHSYGATNDPNITRLETGWLDEAHKEKGYLDEWDGSHSTPFEYTSTAHDNMVQVITGGTAQGWAGPSAFEPNTPMEPPIHLDENDWPDVPIT